MAETKTGLLDTSVLIDLDVSAPDQLPEEASVSAVTMAELSAGPHAAEDPDERARRQDRLQQLESWLEPTRSMPTARGHSVGSTQPFLPLAANPGGAWQIFSSQPLHL